MDNYLLFLFIEVKVFYIKKRQSLILNFLND